MKKTLILFLLVASVVFAALEGQIEITGESDLTETSGSSRDNHRYRVQESYTSGTATTSAQINAVYRATGTLASGAAGTIDLAGSLVDPLGDAVVFTRIRSIIIENTATTTLTIGSSTSNPWTAWSSNAASTLAIPASSCIALSSPFGAWAVTAGTGDILHITNASGGTGTYKLWIVGNE